MTEFAQRFEGVTGSEIRKIFALLKNPEIISFAGGNPSPEAFPCEMLAGISNELILKKGRHVLQYGATPGSGVFIDYLKELNSDILKDTDDIIITTGSSQGIDLFARSLLNEGDPIVVESPTFLGALQTFYLSRANISTVPMEAGGVNIEKFEAVLKEKRPRFFYTIPTFQNPTGITTSEEKRGEIYRLCETYGCAVLEDDPYEELRYGGQPLQSIKSRDTKGIVTKLYSFSKTVSPGLRVGYALAPKDVVAKMNLLKQGADVHTPNLSQAMVLEFLRSGGYQNHIEYLRALYREQRDAMLASLEELAPKEIEYTRPDGGFFIWVTLPGGVDGREIFERCVAQNVAFVPGSPFFAHGGHENTLRLNFSMPNVEMIKTGVARFCGVLKEFI